MGFLGACLSKEQILFGTGTRLIFQYINGNQFSVQHGSVVQFVCSFCILYNIGAKRKSFEHHKANHCYNFVNPQNGEHPQNMEKLWELLK